MNGKNDDYLKQSPHWIYADLCSWNTGRGQTRTKSLKTVIFNTPLSTLSNIYPILLQSGYFSH